MTMSTERLKVREIRARAVVLPLERPIVARIATITEWPLILIDLHTEEGIVGRSYLEPYTPKTMAYLVRAVVDLGHHLAGRPVAPVTLYEAARKSLHFVGYGGQSMIAVSGVDMAAWDALAKAAGVPLCVLLGGTVGAVPVYNSNGLWLREPSAVADEAVELRDQAAFHGLKLRLGRDDPRADVATIEAVRDAVGEAVALRRMIERSMDRGLYVPHADSIVRKAEAWLSVHFTEADPVAGVIAACGIPERSLKRRFKAATSTSLITYCQNLRVEAAKRALETDTGSIEIGCRGGRL